ncbi:protein MAINTENANCE OF MERISTEMS-like [Cryptomeria japonica]|uniref:protein MAINTENANCE OF MERISTEMS-like n=1 Tax=Cryptomeria japonica TaxID=3369 RepID=UPI0027D9D7EC|nr:protein MAINTENANCE OF MERISTEMS-like [Cryptomeria japonica]
MIMHIEACGLRHLLYMLEVKTNRGLLTAFTERWYTDHNSFHLSNGEISVTLEDVYMILHIPITGELVQYDHHEMGGTTTLRKVFDDEMIDGSKVRWEDMLMYYEPLTSILADLIGGFSCPDRISCGISVGWGCILLRMMQHRTRYAWGVCMLAHSYHDLYQGVYDGAASLASSVTLLQIWCWEHIDVTRPIHDQV